LGLTARSAEGAASGASGDPAVADAAFDGPELVTVPASIWALEGTAKVRFGRGSGSGPLSMRLALNADRTFVLGLEGDPYPEKGVWFQRGNRIFLDTQNLLEQTALLEEDIATGLEEAVQRHLTELDYDASISERTGVLRLRSRIRFDAFFPRLGVTLRLRLSSKAIGVRIR
jgi:predicted RNA methylase